jgi:hypothetical protein
MRGHGLFTWIARGVAGLSGLMKKKKKKKNEAGKYNGK